MEIRMKSNTSWHIAILLPLIIICAVCAIFLSISFIIDYIEMKEYFVALIIFIVLDLVLIGIALLIKFFNVRSYKFNEKEMKIYNRGDCKGKIDVEKIEYVHYYPLRWYYIFTIFLGMANIGTMKLIVKEYTGKEHHLGFFSRKDVAKLNELYNNLIEIK